MKHWRPIANPEMVGAEEGTRAFVPLADGSLESRLVPSEPDEDWWDTEHQNGPHYGEPGWTRTRENDATQQVVRYTWSPTQRTIDEAEGAKLAEADTRWGQAMDGGVPVQGNGVVVKLVFDERARNLYAAIPESTANRPTEGMPARLHPPGYQGSLVYDVKGDGVFDMVEKATFSHRCAGNRAWASVYTEIESIKAGPGDDATKVAAIDAINVEVRPVGKEWPSNDAPAI